MCNRFFPLLTNFVSKIDSRKIYNPCGVGHFDLFVSYRCFNTGSAALSTRAVQPRSSPDISKMKYILKVKDQNITVPLSEPEKLWSLKEFDPKLPLVMMVTGWTTNFNDTEIPTLDKIYAAYRCRGNVNFVVSVFCSLFSKSIAVF